MACFLWLAPFPHRAERVRPGVGARRCQLQFPRPEWFLNRLSSIGVGPECLGERPTVPPTWEVAALVRVVPGTVFGSCLTPWTDEAELQWQYWQCPGDAYTARHARDAGGG